MNKTNVINNKIVPAAFAAGLNMGSYPGLLSKSPIITGSVVYSVNLNTTQDAPNSPNDIAKTRLDATIIEGVNRDKRMKLIFLDNLLQVMMQLLQDED